jgi:ABC-type lipopolysaccharide export system ATPase subunit
MHKTAILVVEHNVRSLLEIAHRAYILDKGKIIASDSAQKVLASKILEKIFVGENF